MPERGTAWLTVEATVSAVATVAEAVLAPAVAAEPVEGGETRSLYICRQISVKDEREDRFVSNASRTRMSSRGYVKNTEVTPAKLPETRRRIAVSLSWDGIMTARICS